MIWINFNLHWIETKAYYFEDNNETWIVFIHWIVENNDVIDIRLHSACCFSETFGSNDCDCREQMLKFINIIKSKGKWVLIYLFQEWRGHWLNIKFQWYNLSQEYWLDTYQAYKKLWVKQDIRNYVPAIYILKKIIKTKYIILHTNNPRKIKPFIKNWFSIERNSIVIWDLSESAKNYVECKQKKLWHIC